MKLLSFVSIIQFKNGERKNVIFCLGVPKMLFLYFQVSKMSLFGMWGARKCIFLVTGGIDNFGQLCIGVNFCIEGSKCWHFFTKVWAIFNKGQPLT